MAAFGIPPVSRTKGAMRSQTLQTVVEAGEPDGPDRSSLCIRQHRPGGPKSVPSWKVEHVSASLRAVSSPLMGLGPLCLGRHRISSGAFGSADWLVSSAAWPHRPARVLKRVSQLLGPSDTMIICVSTAQAQPTVSGPDKSSVFADGC